MKKIGIIGGSESGVGAALLAAKLGHTPFVSDGGSLKDSYREKLVSLNISFEEGGHTIDKLLESDMVVKSPGVPDKAPIMKSLSAAGIEIISEVEFASRHYNGKILAITGSNGKTTTTGLLYHTLKNAGLDVEVAGNIGYSFAGLVAEQQPEYVVIEVSSFQLDNVNGFSPYISTVLNVTADHLDRYDYDIEKYADAKYRIAESQKSSDHFIYNADDKYTLSRLHSRPIKPSLHSIKGQDFKNGILKSDGSKYLLSLQGLHNLYNCYTVYTFCTILGIPEVKIAEGLATFVNQAHRLEKIRELNKVIYINDSKATNVDSVYFALEAMETKVVWIAGGQDKGNDYTPLMSLVKDRVSALVCLGADNKKLVDTFQGKIPVVSTSDVNQAVHEARVLAKEGDTVLLSPACASFDLFKNYMDRGDQFRAAVNNLK
jgi:UDP-N-acetylmuramoylalanine--D-glutamate ligase